MGSRRKSLCLSISVLTLATIGLPMGAQAGTLKVIANGNSTTGSIFYGSVLLGAGGKLYVTATEGGPSGNGSVLVFTPPAAGKTAWTGAVIHKFLGLPSDGKTSQAALIADKAGALYGTTTSASADNQGNVFKLTPPAAGQKVWKETILYSFGTKVHDGSQSRAPLVADAKGNLYGTTIYGGTSALCGTGTGCGTVFKLTPPAAGKTAWTETVIHSFGTGAKDGRLPELSPLILNAKGEIFGTAGNGGTFNEGVAFKLTPPAAGKTAWTETILTNFGAGGVGGNDGGSVGGLVFGKTGMLYGALAEGGTGFGSVYQLTPPASGNGAWKQTELYGFKEFDDCNNPQPSLIIDAAGTLWGTAQNAGKVPPSGVAAGCVFSIKPSGASSKETIAYTFTAPPGGSPRQGSMLFAALVADAKGDLFGTTISGGAFSLGTIFELTGSGFAK